VCVFDANLANKDIHYRGTAGCRCCGFAGQAAGTAFGDASGLFAGCVTERPARWYDPLPIDC